MKAFHAFWSAPRRARNAPADYELLTMMLSALKWREKNGEIAMLTDRAGAAFLESAGLASLWSTPPEAVLDGLDAFLDPVRFWAAGKLEALRLTAAPCVMLDTDLIVWQDVRARLGGSVVAAHPEPLSPEIYPAPESVFTLDEGYAFPPEWDFSLPAANTAFLYMPDDTLRLSYVGEAFRFMRALRDTSANTAVTMCFAEQRILPMCARANGAALETLFDGAPTEGQTLATHLWGYKDVLARDGAKRTEYCLGCVLRILTDHPEWEGALAANAQTAGYLDILQRGSAP